MRNTLLFSIALLAACTDPSLKVGLNVGSAGADVGSMAASELRQSKVASDRRFDIRVAAQRAVSANTAKPEMLAAALDSLVDDDKVAFIVSRFLQTETLEAAKRMNAAGAPWLSVTPLPATLTSATGPGFSLVPSLEKQADFLASQVTARDLVTIVHIDDAYGNGLAEALRANLVARGIAIAHVRSYEQNWDEPRMVALGTDIERTKSPTLIYFIGRAPSLELVWQPFREAGKDIRVIASDLVESNALYVNNEGRYTGLKFVRYLDPQGADARMRDLHDRYSWWISRGEMTGEAVLVYDAMQLGGDAVRAGARTRDEFREYFASLGRTRPPFNGVGGPIAFGDDGEVARAFMLAEVTSRGIVAVDD